jgi:hypothetical protein
MADDFFAKFNATVAGAPAAVEALPAAPSPKTPRLLLLLAVAAAVILLLYFLTR